MLCFSPLERKKKRHCDAVDAKSPAACCVQTRSLKEAGWITSKFPDFLFPIWHQAPSIVAVTPTASHKHPLADCLPSQCWHRHFPSLSGRLIFMYFHCNYMAAILDFQHALVFFPPAGAFHPRPQIKLSYCQNFPKPLRIKPNSKQKIKHPNESWRGSKINTMIGAVE